MRKFLLTIFFFITPALTSIDTVEYKKEMLPSQYQMSTQIQKLDALSERLDALGIE